MLYNDGVGVFYFLGDNMDEIVFNSQEELFERIRPALRSKRVLLKQSGFKNVKEQDIWDYLRLNKWTSSHGLELCEMVDDILHTENELIVQYCHSKYMSDKPILEGETIGIDLPKLKS